VRRTKIVCTIGPASSDEATVRGLIDAGMAVARINFSHGTAAEHLENIELVRRVAAEAGVRVAVMQDLCGPKIRTGSMKGGTVELASGSAVTVTAEAVEGTAERFSTQWDRMPGELSGGERILIDDGMLELAVESVEGPDIRCIVIRGGTLGSNKGMNLPGAKLSAGAVTEKDRDDLAYGAEAGVDYIALSFVRGPEDVREIRDLAGSLGLDAHVIAKIERPEAVEAADEIVEAADGIMVARGDLGVELAPELVPGIQKDLIEKANRFDKPVITATQMLESMTEHSRPTRAEVSDVANAILDGTDAVMLSGETAVGAHPVAACRTMARIAEEAEERWFAEAAERPPRQHPASSVQDAIALGAQLICREIGVKALAAATMSGATARYVSKSRPRTSIIALTPDERVAARCALYWGVIPVLAPEFETLGEISLRAEQEVLARGLAADGEDMLLVMGLPLTERGNTNSLHLHRLGSKKAPAK